MLSRLAFNRTALVLVALFLLNFIDCTLVHATGISGSQNEYFNQKSLQEDDDWVIISGADYEEFMLSKASCSEYDVLKNRFERKPIVQAAMGRFDCIDVFSGLTFSYSTFTECGDAGTVTVEGNVGMIPDVRVEFSTPPSFNFEGNVTGGTVLGTSPNNIQLDLNNGGFSLTFDLQGRCDAGDDDRIDFLYIYDGGADSCDIRSLPLVVEDIFLEVAPEGTPGRNTEETFAAVLGEVDTLTTTITQLAVGALNEVYYYVDDHPLLNLESVYVCETGQELTATFTAGTRTYYTLDNSVLGADGFIRNEGIDICEVWRTVDCPDGAIPQIFHGVVSSCSMDPTLDICDSGEGSASLDYGLLFPEMYHYVDVDTDFNPTCPSESPKLQRWWLVNEGTAPLGGVSVRFTEFGGGTPIDVTSFMYTAGSGGTPMSVVDGGTNTDLRDREDSRIPGCMNGLPNRSDLSNRVTVDINDFNVAIGDTLFIEYQIYPQACNCSSCDVYRRYGVDISSIEAFDLCGTSVQDELLRSNVVWPSYDVNFADFAEAPVTNCFGETSTYSLTVTNYTNDFLSNQGNNSQDDDERSELNAIDGVCTTCYLELTITLPNGLDFVGPDVEWTDDDGTVWSADVVDYTDNDGGPDMLIVRWTGQEPSGWDGFSEASGIFFDYTPDCDNELARNPDCGPILYEDQITKSLTWNYGDCPGCASETIECEESLPVIIKCPGTMMDCPCAGFVQTYGDGERANLYEPDSDNNRQPGPGNDYNENILRTDRFIKGDSIAVCIGGYVNTTAAITSFDYLYATVDFPNGDFVPIGGQVEIHTAAGPIYTCDVLTQQILAGDVLLTDLSIDRLMANGCSTAVNYTQDDSIALKFYYRSTTDFTGDVNLLQYRTRMFTMDGPFGMGTEYSCRIPFDYRLTQVGTQTSFDYYTSRLNNFEGCQNGTPYYRGYSRIGSGNVDYFPSEYIGEVEFVDQFRATIPEGMAFDFFRFYLRRENSGGTNSLGGTIAGQPSFWDIGADHPAITIIGDQLIFDTETFLQEENGGVYPFSDEGYSWSFQPYYVATCNLEAGPVDGSEMESDHRTNESIFCRSEYLDSGERTNLNYRGGAEILIEAVDRCIEVDQFPKCGRVRIQNLGNSVANNVWLSFENQSGFIIIDSVTNVTGGAENVIDGDEFNMYQLGNLIPNGSILIDLCTYSNICDLDSVEIYSGYDCLSAPRIREEAVCSSRDAIEFKPVSASLSMVSKFPDNIVLDDLCDTIPYVVDVSAGGPGFLDDVVLDITLPLGMMLVPGSFEIAYPTTAGPTDIPPDSEFESVSDPINIYGNTFRLNVTGEDADFPDAGLIGSDGAASNRNVVNVRYQAFTKCGYGSGSRVFYESTATNGCGDVLRPVQKDFSGRVNIFGAPPPFLSQVDVDGDALNACMGEQTTLEVNYGVNGTISTTAEDSIRIILPPGVTYVDGSYRFGTNPNTNPPVVQMEGGLQVLYWGISGLTPGSNATFSIDIVAMDIGQECKEFPVTVQTYKSAPAYCDATMENCSVRAISDEASDNITIIKPELAVMGGTLTVMESAPNEMLMYEFIVTNTSDVPSTSDNILVVDLFSDTNGNGRVDIGSDVLLTTVSLPAEVGPGEMATLSGTATIPAGASCGILAYIDIDKNCACEVSTSARIEVNLALKFDKDVEVCSNEPIILGPVNNAAYQYEWFSLGGSDLAALNATNTTPVTFSYDNNTGSTIVWNYGIRVLRAPGCYTFDTLTVTIFPETEGELSTMVCGPIADCGDMSGDGFSLSGPLDGSNYNWTISSGDMSVTIEEVDNPTSFVSGTLTETTVFELSYLDENGCAAEFTQTVSLLNCACTSLGDTVWFDFNVDGIQDPTEPGIEGVTVFLYNSSDLSTPIQSTMTDANGRYIFEPLPQGEYVVRFDTSGYTGPYHLLVATLQDAGGDDTVDSDADPVTGFTGPYFIPNGISDTTVDAGFYPAFDLALIKEIDTDVSPGPYFAGDNITYTITVVNQGGYYGASDVEITDYLPADLTYVSGSSGATTSALGETVVITNNGAGQFSIDTLPPLDTVRITLELQIDAGFTGDFVDNYAEISDYTAPFGLEDVDSDADDNDSNDAGGVPETDTDNTFDGNGTDDEDDHDPARVTISELDLALRKKINPDYNPEPIAVGELVKFDIIIFNQGNVPVDSVEVEDYSPSGLTFDATNPLNVAEGWQADEKAVIDRRLLPGEIDTVCIYLLAELSMDPADYINAAEITAAWDTTTGREIAGFDIDSEPGSNTPNEQATTPDSPGDNNIISTGDDQVGSQDDHDVESVEVQFVDVALTKMVDPSVDPTTLKLGDPVKFVINVINQGTMTGKTVEVTDYIPAGYSFDATDPNNSMWTVMNASTVMTELSNLIPNSSQAVCIWLTLEPTSNNDDYINYAEVSRFVDNDDIDRSDEDIDSPLNDVRTDNRGGTVDSDADNAVDGDGSGAIPDTDAGTDQDNHDPARVAIFDLALRKTVVTPGPYAYGTPVTFQIEIFNQGTVPANNIVVTDSVPEGYMFNAAGSPGWDDTNAPEYSFTYTSGPIMPGASDVITISLIPISTSGGNDVYTNRAEISSAEDDMGTSYGDIDSNPDSDFSNDNGGEAGGPTNDQINDDGTVDEDDEDPAMIQVFDLALNKILINPQATYLDGDVAEYRITVYNQGNEPATGVVISDYLPCGMSFINNVAINPGWSVSGASTVEYAVPGTIMPGGFFAAEISLTVEVPPVGCSAGDDPYKNMSEITEARDRNGDAIDDIDSRPGSNGAGEQAVEPNGPGDDVIDMSVIGGNEDDHDPASLMIFDLALSKVIDRSYNDVPYRLGETVKFDITITNQGNLCTDSFQIVDYIPAGLEFNTTLNAGIWTVNGAGDQARYLYFDDANPICFLEEVVVSIYLDVVSSTDPDGYVNYAEIEVARDVDENVVFTSDNDGAYDDDVANDSGGQPNTPDDNNIDGRGPNFSEDEDDHDPALVEILDLALVKTIATPGPYDYGDVVDFDITVHNQGNTLPETVVVSDYIPNGFEFVAADNPMWSLPATDRAEYTINDPFANRNDTTITISLVVLDLDLDAVTSDSYTNIAEISNVIGAGGVSLNDWDVDSDPDTNPSDDEGGEPESFNDDRLDGDGTSSNDEDDHDPALLRVLDLALKKRFVDMMTPIIPGADVTFMITIFNQGNITPEEFNITDYFTPSLSLSVNDMNGWTEINDSTAELTYMDDLLPGDSLNVFIVATIDAMPDLTNLFNFAEISYVEGEEGEDITGDEIDSTPDDIRDNDNGGEVDGPTDDEIDDDGTVDEDDHDGARAGFLDLALFKTTDQTEPVKPGDDVVFTINIVNQGIIVPGKIAVVDYIPDGFVLSPNDVNGWMATGMGNNVVDTITTPIGFMDTLEYTITLRVLASATPAALVNVAEIKYVEDQFDNDITALDIDSTPDEDATNDAGGELNGPTDNETTLEDPEDEDDQDPADVPLFDLAITKMTTQTLPAQWGETITFEICVENQGNITADSVEITDRMGPGLRLDPADANGWEEVNDSTATVVLTGPWMPGDVICVDIDVIVQQGAQLQDLNNVAEITAAEDDMDNDRDDDDFDSDVDNDDGDQSEDDEDAEEVLVFDLALRKTVNITEPVEEGDTIMFWIEVFNQGNVSAVDVGVRDYVPEGYTYPPALNAGTWTNVGPDVYEHIFADSLHPGELDSVMIQLIIAPGARTQTLVNLAEIYSAGGLMTDLSDRDVDSEPNGDPNDDTGGEVYTDTDDEINDNGTLDEDDQDPAGVLICKEITCNGKINFTLDENCEGVIAPENMLTLVNFPPASYTIRVLTKSGATHANFFDGNDVGRCFNVIVENPACGGLNCWGEVCIESKLPPVLYCRDTTVLVDCSESTDPEFVGFPLPVGAMATRIPGTNEFTVNALAGCGEATLSYYDIENPLDCSASVYRTIERTWTLTTRFGMKTSCTELIGRRPASASDVVFPTDFDGISNFHLECDDQGRVTRRSLGAGLPEINVGWNALDNGLPSPYPDPINARDTLIGTGYPEGAECDQFAVSYKDRQIETCGPNTYKLIRTWRVFDWCTGATHTHNQFIKVVDTRAPEVSCPPSNSVEIVEVVPWTCEASYIVPAPIYDPSGQSAGNIPVITRECSNWSYEVRHKVATNPGMNPGDCQNVPTTGTFFTQNVRQLPDGRFEIFDMPLGCNWVEYIIRDDCDNVTTCRLDVFVKDGYEPVAVCDEHTVVSLNDSGRADLCAMVLDNGSTDNCSAQGDLSFAIKRMGEPDSQFRSCIEVTCADVAISPFMVVFRVFDEQNNYSECMVEATVQDNTSTGASCPQDITIDCLEDYHDEAVTGAPTSSNLCTPGKVSYTIAEEELNDCGIGYVIKRWEIEYNSGQKTTCDQRIDIVDNTPFDGTNIVWPDDVTINGCILADAEPTNLPMGAQMPGYINGDCAKPVGGHKDTVSYNDPDYCMVIRRTWEVIDWCQYNILTNAGPKWRHVQVIKVENDVKPTIDPTSCTDVVTCVDASCEADIDITPSASDDCTAPGDLDWTYQILSLPSRDVYDSGQGRRLNRKLPVGAYEVEWTVVDLCGNTDECASLITINDCQEPTPYCKPGIVTTIMPSSGMVEIWASDFNDSSSDNCTDSTDLIFSFSSDTGDQVRMINCDSLENGIVDTFDYQMWVTDQSGNQDFCQVIIIVQDNQDRCTNSNNGKVNVSGLIRTSTLDEVEAVDVELMMNSSTMEKTETFNDGVYHFTDLEMNQDYAIRPYKNDDPMNGVSTADLVTIQRHLLGLKELDSPYKLIAADANNSEEVTAADISIIRKLILGVYAEFPNNTSWRFLDQSTQFIDSLNPWIDPLDEMIHHNQMDTNQLNTNFTGIKVGDVTDDVRANGLSNNHTRNGGNITFNVKKVNLMAGQLASLPVRLSSDQIIHGFQFTWEFPQMRNIDVISGILDIDRSHFNWNKEARLLTMSWHSSEALHLSESSVLFEIVALPDRPGELMDESKFSDAVTRTEAYTMDMETVGLTLNMDRADQWTNKLYQNVPNPFSSSTKIEFELVKDMEATLEIYATDGSSYLNVKIPGKKGMNSFNLDADRLPVNGVYYYQLHCENFTDVKKLMLRR